MRFLISVLAGLAVAGAIFGLAATNTVPGTRAGDGSKTISGYTVSNVTYNLNASNPQIIDSVSFQLDQPATTVKVRLQSGGTWYGCTNTSANNWSCSTTNQAVQSATELRVVALQ